MQEFYDKSLEILKSGKNFMFASIFDSQSSVQRTTVLKQKGFILDGFNKVHNSTETPEEIAVSIAAELIKVRKERLI
jgi:hypothetical protein